LNRTELISWFHRNDFYPSHRLGQNFLVDGNLARKLVSLCALQPGDPVLEVGPGVGIISRAILDTGAHLSAIECDERLLNYMEDAFLPEFGDRLQLIHGDAVKMPLAGISESANLTVIANPPFSITGPWIAGMLDIGVPRCFALLLQREAVERLTATPGSKGYGTLSIRLSAAYDLDALHPVPHQCFHPAPMVEAQIVVFLRKEAPVAFRRETLQLMATLFQNRRKQLGGRCSKLLTPSHFEQWEKILHSHNLQWTCRPEELSWQVWAELDGLAG
jgi:16S rRNA (adenine1518-N6/adenine1519-N6)-dimethyltransferase